MEDMIGWGMIGCGDVTEVKSGPAFSKVKNSKLLAVMARNEDRVRDYVTRHNISAYYTDIKYLLAHPGINAIYIATPPDTHEYFAREAFAAGKNVYVEKPMALHSKEAGNILAVAKEKKCKLVIAHYRRAQPMFTKVKTLIDENAIGKPLSATIDFRRRALSAEDLQIPKTAWRLDPSKSGGGLFHDMAPHQIGLLYYFFGDVLEAKGFAVNQSTLYAADDVVTGTIKFKNEVLVTGHWCFSSHQEVDDLTIIGTNGSISFPVFDKQEVVLINAEGRQVFRFEKLEHVQQPLIEKTVQYFLGKAENPCPPEEGLAVMLIIDTFTKKH